MQVANQTIYFKSSECMEEVESDSVTLIVTSPPYWNVRNYGDVKQIGFGQSYGQYIESLNKVWEECIRVLQPNGKIAINLQPLPISNEHSGFGRRVIQNIMFDVEAFMRKNDMFLSGMHYWDKAPYVNNVSWGSYPKPTNIASNTSFEQIFVWVKRGKTRKIEKEIMDKNLLQKQEWRHWAVRCIWDDISPVIKVNSKGNNVFGHGAPFPEDIPHRIIRMHTVEGERVLDPFLGSGTTLKMCRILSRKGIGYELNPEYEDLIEKRIMEDWSPPEIQTNYVTLGSETLKNVFKSIINEAWKLRTIGDDTDKSKKESKEFIYQEVLKMLKKGKRFTKSFLQKLQRSKAMEIKPKDSSLQKYLKE